MKHGINRLSRKLGEILVFFAVHGEKPCTNMAITAMGYLELAPDLASKVLAHDSLKLLKTQNTKEVIHGPSIGLNLLFCPGAVCTGGVT